LDFNAFFIGKKPDEAAAGFFSQLDGFLFPPPLPETVGLAKINNEIIEN